MGCPITEESEWFHNKIMCLLPLGSRTFSNRTLSHKTVVMFWSYAMFDKGVPVMQKRKVCELCFFLRDLGHPPLSHEHTFQIWKWSDCISKKGRTLKHCHPLYIIQHTSLMPPGPETLGPDFQECPLCKKQIHARGDQLGNSIPHVPFYV